MGSKTVSADHAFDDEEPFGIIRFGSAVIAGATVCPICNQEITREGGKTKCENCKVEVDICCHGCAGSGASGA